jgi:hypothetical protein
VPLPVNDKQFKAVSALNPAARLEHFIARVTDEEEVTVIRTADYYFLISGLDQPSRLPLWPHPRYASAWASVISLEANAATISLDELLETTLPDLAAKNIGISVFPVGVDPGITMTVPDLSARIRAALSDWYGE